MSTHALNIQCEVCIVRVHVTLSYYLNIIYTFNQQSLDIKSYI